MTNALHVNFPLTFSWPRTLFLTVLTGATVLGVAAFESHGKDGMFGYVTGVGPQQTESRTLPPFHAVETLGSLTVKCSPGDASSAVVTAQANLLPHLRTEVRDGTLHIFSDCTFTSDAEQPITVTSPHLDQLKIAGSGTLSAAEISGAEMNASVIGSGEMVLSGVVQNLTTAVSGSGTILGEHLKAKDADASIKGSGHVSVFATERINGSVIGSGSVQYTGNPDSVLREVIGSGEVTAAK
jgi:hypothetical protein